MRMRTMLWMVTFVIVCVSVTTLLKTVDRTLFSRNRSGQPPTVAAPSAPSSQMPPLPQSNSTRQFTVRPPAVSARDQHREAMRLLSEGERAQQQALEYVARWKTEIEPLRDDTSGDVVAANEDLVKKLAHVSGRPRMTQNEIEIMGQEIERFKTQLAAMSTEDDAELLSAREMYDIRDLHAKANAAQGSWEAAVEQGNAIVLKARYGAQPVAQPTLGEEMDRIAAEAALGKLDAEIAQGATAEPVIGPIPEGPPVDVNPELRAQALSAAVASTLAPFLEARTIQPSLSGPSVKFVKTYDKQPMSLQKLASMGALDESVVGLMRLASVGGNRKLPEPKWSISAQPNSWREEDEEFLKRAQRMLRDYGSILVSEGLLSP